MNTLTDIDLPADHPVFAGHFPDRPMVPGALLLDEVVQAAGRLRPGARWRLAAAKFLSPAVPGDALAVELVPPAEGGTLRFRVLSGARVIASGALDAA